MSSRRAGSPPTKRVKLESDSLPRPPSILEVSPHAGDIVELGVEADLVDEEHCSICLQPYVDRTLVPKCSHEFCFECLLIWTDQSRKCPLCSQAIGEYLIHHIRSNYDYQKHYLTPLRTSPRPQSAAVAAQRDARRRARTRREREWGRRQREAQEEADELELAIEKRRWIYRHRLYAKHVASNPYTRYRPFPTPAQFSASQDLISRATVFLRRELRVWVGLDVEFLTTFALSLMKSLDIRSEAAVRLLAEFLDMDSGEERVNAEHFAHELYSYLRSPYRDLARYDEVVQYDVPQDVPPPSLPQRSQRWRSRYRSVSTSRSRSSSRSSVRGASRHARSPLPLSRRHRSRSHGRSISSSPPRRPNDYSSRSRNERSGQSQSDPQTQATRRRSRDGQVIDRSRGYSRAAQSSQPMHQNGTELASRSERFMPRSREDVAGPGDYDHRAHGEPTGDITVVDGATQEGKGPEHHYVDADEHPSPASSNRTPTLVSHDHDPSPLTSALNFASSKADDQRGANIQPAGSPAIDRAAECTQPLAPAGISVRRVASARVKSRSLLQSVQAHLSLRLRPEHGWTNSGPASLTTVPSRGADDVSQRDQGPSLLERLSEAVPTLPQDSTKSSKDRETPLYGDAPRSPPSAASSQPASAGIEAEERHSVDDGLTVMASTRTGAATPPTRSDTRELLLGKLAKERLLHSHTAAGRARPRIPLARNSSDSIATGASGAANIEVDNSAGSAAEREARLRSQAQLRVRLAAAKKAARNTEDSSTREDVSATHGDTFSMEGTVQSQEEALRHMLAERRGSAVAHK